MPPKVKKILKKAVDSGAILSSESAGLYADTLGDYKDAGYSSTY